jgi:hypothetical protein
MMRMMQRRFVFRFHVPFISLFSVVDISILA